MKKEKKKRGGGVGTGYLEGEVPQDTDSVILFSVHPTTRCGTLDNCISSCFCLFYGITGSLYGHPFLCEVSSPWDSETSNFIVIYHLYLYFYLYKYLATIYKNIYNNIYIYIYNYLLFSLFMLFLVIITEIAVISVTAGTETRGA